MPRRPADTRTLDLFSWEPPEIVPAYDEGRLKSASLRARIARGVAATLKDCEMSREAVADAMGDWLGEDVSKNMLDAYASESRDEHTIPFLRVLALVQVTGDVRLLTLGAETSGHAVIEERYLGAVYEAMWTAEEERARDKRLASRRRWRGRP